jgi:hypothetical protein
MIYDGSGECDHASSFFQKTIIHKLIEYLDDCFIKGYRISVRIVIHFCMSRSDLEGISNSYFYGDNINKATESTF